MAQPTTQVIANRYQLNHTIGAGGMGAVYRAFDRLTQTHVALKQVHVPLSQVVLSSFNDGGETHQLALTREFQTLASLRHPNIISVLDYGFYDDVQTSQTPFFTMELLTKPVSLHDAATDPQTTVQLIAQILQALTYLHRRGIIHSDLKPGNVLVHDDRVRVLDFGLSVTTETARGHGGTLPYMPPEQLTRGIITMQGDLYTVGIIAYELLAGHLPFESQNLTAKLRGQADMQAVNAPDAVRDVIAKLLQRQPQDRYASATDARRALLQAIGDDVPPEDETVRESFLQAAAFVGRDDELKTLQTAFETVAKGGVALHLVGGESGVGKTRLLDELRIQAMVNGALVIRGQAATDGLPFQVWRNIAPHLLLEVDVSNTQAQILKDIVPNAANLLDKPVDDAPALSGQAYVQRLGLTLVDIIKQMQRPLVLLLEDLHWATGDLAILKQVLQVSDQLHHLMIIGTYRSDEAPALPDDLNGMATLQLERLSPVYIKALSESMLGEQGMQENVLELLERETEGNIFFLVETVRALAEEVGSLERVGLTTLPDHVFTGKMQQLMQRRLNKVAEQYLPVQLLAAILGREIDVSLLNSQYEPKWVDEWLSNAAENAVLTIQDNRWRFAHDKLRETVIKTIAPDDKPGLHQAAAEAIETTYPDNAAYNQPLLLHWQMAGNLDKEMLYLIPVVQQMIEIQGAYDQAGELLIKANERLMENDARRVSILNWLARKSELQGQFDKILHYAEPAYQLAELVNDQRGLARSLQNLGIATSAHGDYSKAAELYKRSIRINEAIGNKGDMATSLNNLAITVYKMGDVAYANELFRQSLAIREALNDQQGLAATFNNLAIIAYHEQALDVARDFYQQSLVIRQQLGEQRGIAQSFSNLGLVVASQADYTYANELYAQSLAISRKIGDKWGTANTLSILGWNHLDQDPTQSSRYFVESLQIAYETEVVERQLTNIIGLACVLHKDSKIAKAAEIIGFVQNHPNITPGLQIDIDNILPDLEATLSPDVLQSAFKRGKQMDLHTLINDLLRAFSPIQTDTNG